MKISILTTVLLLLLSSCTFNNNIIVEGENDLEIESCKLVKEYIIYQSRVVSEFDQIECEFLVEDSANVVINLKPTPKHPDYEGYLDFIKGKEEGSEMLKYLISVDTENKILMDNNISNDPFKSIFIKDGEDFRNVTKKEALNFQETL